MAVSHSASALGEAIGKLIEDEIERIIKPICTMYQYTYDRGGKRAGKRPGVKLIMINKSGNLYQLDGVIENQDGQPIVLLESKYLRYKKHNRDKASWTCAAHYSLRKHHPSIRKSIAVISGNWSLPSKKFMESFGIELHEIPFNFMCQILQKFNIIFDWDEKDRATPEHSLSIYNGLSASDKNRIGGQLLDPISQQLSDSIELTLREGEDWVKRLNEVEVLLKTDRQEYITRSFDSARSAIQYLLELQEDVADIRGKV